MIKVKCILKLDNPCPGKWATWKWMEEHLQRESEEKGMTLQKAEYNEEEKTKSVVCTYSTDEDFFNAAMKIQACCRKHGLEISLLEKKVSEAPELDAINEYFDKEKT